MEELIVVRDLSKKFCRDLKTSLWYGVKDLSAEFFGGRIHTNQLRPKEFWAVKDVNFELKRGECLGLIGANGAGKSTLLKMLNGLIKPDTGYIEMKGRVMALIELGAGFNPILTGRENIYNNGAVLGIKKREVDKLLAEIVEFSELEEFIDTPVQYYSSGMKVRLGFSVAVHMKPDVLILDEVLAVGDGGFRMKSFNKINEIIRDAAVIFVSHSMPQVAAITNRVLLLGRGKVEHYGDDIALGIEKYFDHFQGDNPKIEFNEFAEVVDCTILSTLPVLNGETHPVIDYCDNLKVQLALKIDSSINEFHVKLQITDKELKIVGIYDSHHFQGPIQNNQNVCELEVDIPNCIFTNGEYALTIFIQEYDNTNDNKNIRILATYRYWRSFKVRSTKGLGYVPSVVYLPGSTAVKVSHINITN